jgi:hypothetical protein
MPTVKDACTTPSRRRRFGLFEQRTWPVRAEEQLPGSTYFTNWHLPYTMYDEIEPLLCLFLGQTTGESIFGRIKVTPLLNHIRSGYDVRLIADLVVDQGKDVALPIASGSIN